MRSLENWIDICKLSDIAPNTGVCAKFKERQVAVFHIHSKSLHGSKVKAISNLDPYSNANVLSRGLITEKEDRYFVASPLLKQQFCLETGATDQDDNIQIHTYDARIHDGLVQLRDNG